MKSSLHWIGIEPVSLPTATATVAYSQTLTTEGGTGSDTSSLASGTLPGGLALSSAGVL